ncbi:MAG: tyrosine-type recombinase/integrase [SAR324 cluster bacterium]|nr:tyrosine-type recombinase/integrase [SAR324 cluster bacterium]
MEQNQIQPVLSEYFTFLQAEKGLAPATQTGYLRAVEGFLGQCLAQPQALFLSQGWGWEQLDKRAVEIYLRHLADVRGWRPATVRNQAGALRAFFNFLHYRGRIQRNPARNLTPGGPSPRREPPEGEERAVQRLLEAAPDSLAAARRVAAMELIYGGGLRPSEAYQVRRIRLLSGSKAVIGISEGKERSVELSQAGRARLTAYLEQRGRVVKKGARRPFWVNERGEPVGPGTLARAVRRAMEEGGLPGGGKALRQLSARHFRERGGDLRSLKQLLGAKRLSGLDWFSPPDVRAVYAQFRRIHPRQEKP